MTKGNFVQNDKGASIVMTTALRQNDKVTYTLNRKCMISPSWTT